MTEYTTDLNATAVYHHKQSSGTDQEPIACVSSYYDPTNATTAQNGGTDNLPWGPNGSNLPANPDLTTPAVSADRTMGLSILLPILVQVDSAIATHLTELKAQAKMMFPNGRIVNKSLQNALRKLNLVGHLQTLNH